MKSLSKFLPEIPFTAVLVAVTAVTALIVFDTMSKNATIDIYSPNPPAREIKPGIY